MATQGPKTGLAAILLAIRQRLADGLTEEVVGSLLKIPITAILFSRVDQAPRFNSNQDIVLRVTGPRPYPGMTEGHGEIAPVVTRGLIVEIRSRFTVDQPDRVDNWLLLMQLPLEDAVLTALTLFRPMDVTAPVDVLTVHGIRLTSGQEYRDEIRKIPNPDKTWGSSYLTFAIDYAHTAPDLPEVTE